MDFTPVPRPRLALIEARQQRGWSQTELAERLGTTQVNVSRWERGLTRPGPFYRRKLIRLLGKTEQVMELAEATPAMPTGLQTQNGVYDPGIPHLPMYPFVGRAVVLTLLKQRIFREKGGSLTALSGLPGVGKTTTIVELVHDRQVRRYFEDGMLWANLGPTPNTMSTMSRWARLLGLPARESDNLNSLDVWTYTLRNLIGQRRMLIVLDDAWRIEDALALKVGGPNAVYLLTSRIPPVAGQFAPDGAIALEEFNEDESFALLRALAPDVVKREAESLSSLIRTVGGLPLALILMGGYLRARAGDGQLGRIHSALEGLTETRQRLQISGTPDLLKRSAPSSTSIPFSLASAIATSIEHLDGEANAALQALSLFPAKPHSFSEMAALAVAACPIAALDALLDAGILEGRGDERYCLHQTIADYAQLQLAGSGKQEVAVQRLLAYATGYLEAHGADYGMIDQESNVLVSALAFAHADAYPVQLIAVLCALLPYLFHRGLYEPAMAYEQKASEAAHTLGDLQALARILLYKGRIARQQGSYSQADDWLQEGLRHARLAADTYYISELLYETAILSMRRGNYHEAITRLEEALALAREIGELGSISGNLKELGIVYGTIERYDQSIAYFQESLEVAQQLKDGGMIGRTLVNLGVTQLRQGSNTGDERLLREGNDNLLAALKYARERGARPSIGFISMNLGITALFMREHESAERYFREALEIETQLGERAEIGYLYTCLGRTALRQHDLPGAKDCTRRGLSLLREVGMAYYLSECLCLSGDIALEEDRHDEAEAAFRELEAMLPQEQKGARAVALYGFARLAARRGNLSDARRLAEASLALFEGEHFGLGLHTRDEVAEWIGAELG